MAHDNQNDDVQRQDAWRQVVARAWSDDAFKARLQASPREVLAEFGIAVPADLQLKLVEDEPGVKHLVLPRRETQVALASFGDQLDPGF
jgi:hypothetical protein